MTANHTWISLQVSTTLRCAARLGAGAAGLAVLLMPAGILAAAAGARLEKSIRSTEAPRVTVTNAMGGAVAVRGWDKTEVHAVCLTASPKVTMDLDQMPGSGEAEKVRFTSRLLDEQAGPQEKGVNCEIDVPNGATLEIHNPSGNVTVERVAGDEWVETVSGSIMVADAQGHTSLTTLSGGIELVRPRGRVEASSIMGDLRFTASQSRDVRAQTGSGSIFFDGEFVPLGDYVLITYAGSMDVSCPAGDSLELRARTVHGKVNNELRLSRARRNAPAPAAGNAFGVQKNGDATVELKSYSGSIHVHPRQ